MYDIYICLRQHLQVEDRLQVGFAPFRRALTKTYIILYSTSKPMI